MPDGLVTYTTPSNAPAHVALLLPQGQQPPPPTRNLIQLGNAAAGLCVRSPKVCATAVTASLLSVGASIGAGIFISSQPSAWTGHVGTSTPRSIGTTEVASETVPSPTPAPPPQGHNYEIDDALLPPGVSANMVPGPMAFNASQLDVPRSACASLDGYVNGRWRERLVMENVRSRQGTVDMLRDRSLLIRFQLANQIAAQPNPSAAEKVIGDLWASAMDTSSIEAQALAPLEGELDRIDFLSNGADVLDHLAWLTAQGRNPVQDFSAHPDMQAPGTHLGYLAQGELGLPDSAWYADPEKAEILAAYRDYITRMLILGGTDPTIADAQADKVLALETELAAHAIPFAALAADDQLYYNPVDRHAAAAAVPGIDWPAFLAAQGQGIDTRFSLGMPGYHQRLAELTAQAPIATWRTYLRFRALDRAAPCLHPPLVAAHEAFHGAVLRGRSKSVLRWAAVLDIIERHAGDAFSETYVPVVFPQASSSAADALVGALRTQLHERLGKAEWMTPATRVLAQEKAEQLRIDIGHPRHWPDWKGADTDRSSFLHDVDAVQRFVHQRNIKKIGQPVDADEWKLTAQSVDAYHDALQNWIIIPAAMLQPPFFDPSADAPLNYGGIGVVIGHEMAHGFDSSGASVDGHGRLHDWWQAEDHARFEQLRMRLEEQASRYSIDGHRMDGVLTFNENLADFGGLAIALDAMRAATAGTEDPMIDDMSREQRFFANYAACLRMHSTPERAALDMALNDHAVPSVRADLGPSNMKDYAAAFNCSDDTPMSRPTQDRVEFL